MYNAPTKPCLRSKGCPRKLTPIDEDLIIEFLSRYPTSSFPGGVWVSTSTVSRKLIKVREDPLDGCGGTGCFLARHLYEYTRYEDATDREKHEEGMRR